MAETTRIDDLRDIRAFIEVAHTGSLLRAAPALGCTSSAISKALQRLEERLGVRLVRRSTRHVALTDEGQAYLNDCERILDELTEAGDSIIRRKGAPSGKVRVELPLIWGPHNVAPLLPKFASAYPEITLQILFTDRRSRHFDHAIDVSVRVGKHEEEGIISKPLLPTRAALVASPKYLATRGVPMSISDLERHACIHYLEPISLNPYPWFFRDGERNIVKVFNGPILINNPDAMREVAISGIGLVQGPEILFSDALASGRLRQVLVDKLGDGPTIHIAWLRNRYLPRRVRTFIDWISSAAQTQSR